MGTAALIATGDPRLADDLMRLAAAANADAEIARSAAETRTAWHRSPLVLVGADLADAVAAQGLTRRAGVVLVPTTGPGSPDAYRAAVQVGAQDVAALPDDESWLVDALAAAAEPCDGWAGTVCVAGGRGGAGASVLAAVLGLVAARTGLRTLLVDGDPLGGGVDLLLGQEQAPGARWPDLAGRRGRLSAETLRQSLPSVDGLAMLSWDRGDTHPPMPEAMHSVLDAATRGFDLIVVDLARWPDEAGRVALRAAFRTLLVVPAELRATAAADRVAGALRRDTDDIRLVVRDPAPSGLSGEAIADALGLPLAGVAHHDRRLPTSLEHGDLARTSRRGPLTDLSKHLLADLDLSALPRTPVAA